MKNERCCFLTHYWGPRILLVKALASDTGLFKNTLKENKDHTASFLRENCLKLRGYLSLSRRQKFFPLVQLSVDFHKGDKRKATEDPYFKHIFYTSYLSYELLKTLKYNKEQAKIFVVAALFHDAIEMRKKTNPNFDGNDLLRQIIDKGMNEDEAEKVFTIVSLLTPEPKITKLDSKSWIRRKNADFDYVMQISGEQVSKRYVDLFSKSLPSTVEADKIAEMVKQIKIADDAAILKEIKDDITYKRDHRNIKRNGIRTLKERFQVYKARTEIIQGIYPDHPLLEQMQDDLRFIQKHLRLS